MSLIVAPARHSFAYEAALTINCAEQMREEEEEEKEKDAWRKDTKSILSICIKYIRMFGGALNVSFFFIRFHFLHTPFTNVYTRHFTLDAVVSVNVSERESDFPLE